MGYFLLLLGVFLVLCAWRPALAAWRATPRRAEAGTLPVEPLLERLEALEGRVAELVEAWQELAHPLLQETAEKQEPPAAGREDAPAAPGREAPAFAEVLRRAEDEAWRREIYAAADAGEDPASIARRLGRGKGEIELILRLRGKS